MTAFDDALERLERLNQVIRDLDEAIKVPAFEAMRPFLAVGDSIRPPRNAPLRDAPPSDEPAEESADADTVERVREFLARQDGDKPSDNVYAITAWLYAEYGIQSFRATEIEDLAHEAGVTVPAKVYMTLEGMAKDGKKLVRKVGKGSYRVTVHGEKYFRDRFGVGKGTRKRVKADE